MTSTIDLERISFLVKLQSWLNFLFLHNFFDELFFTLERTFEYI